MAYRATDRLVGDLAYVRDLQLRLYLHCENHKCRHHVELDLAELLARHGEGYTLHEFILRCVCAKCGGRFPDLTLLSVPDYKAIASARPAGESWYDLLDRAREQQKAAEAAAASESVPAPMPRRGRAAG